MADKRRIELVLLLQDKFSKSLQNTTKHLTTFERSASRLGSRLTTAFSVAAIARFTQTVTEAAATQQLAEEKLAGSIANVAGARQGDFEALTNQAAALQQLTAIGDEEIINNQALLATFQLNGDQIQKLIPRILDMGAANAKTGELTDDLKASTLAVGKVFTTGIGVLGRYGVAMTDAQKEAFNLANEEEKLQLLTEVLDENFKGAAETVGKTFAGRVAKAKNAVGDLTEDIGFALIPTLENLLGGVENATSSMSGNQNRIDSWAKTIFRVSNFIVGLAKTVKLIITGIVAFADTLVSAAKVAIAFGTDVINAFKNMQFSVKDIITGLAKLFSGDLLGGLADFKKGINLTLTNTTASMAEFSANTTGWGLELGDQWDSIGKSMLQAIDLEGFQPVERASVETYRSLNDGAAKSAEKTKDSAKKAADGLEKLAEKYKDLSEKSTDALFDLKEGHKKTLTSIRSEIDKTVSSIDDLNRSFAASRQQDVKSAAEQVIATEQRVADIQKQLAGDVSDERRDELNAELLKQQQALAASAGFIQSISGEVAEARRVAGLTELERTIEEFEQRRALAEEEHSAKLKTLEIELVALRLKEKQEIALFEEKEKIILGLLEQSVEDFEAIMQKRVEITEENIQKEIDKFKELIEVINEVKNVASGSQLQQLQETKLNIPAFADGGIVTKPTIGLIGENGAEAIVPLSKLGRGSNGNGNGGDTFIFQTKFNGPIGNKNEQRKFALEMGNSIIKQFKNSMRTSS